MKKTFLRILLIYCFVGITNLSFPQNDYIVTVSGDSISNVRILSYPENMNLYVNVYNKKLSPRYEDFKIVYTTPKGKEKKELYSNIRAFSVNGVRFISWHARQVPYVDGAVVFEKIMELEGKQKEEVYALCKSWLISSFNLTADAIQRVVMEDKLNGIISIKNVMDGLQKAGSFSSWLNYDLTIRVKDGKCKLTISNIRYHYEKGFIFNDNTVTKFNVNAENMVTEWRDSNGDIFSHLYRGLMLMFYCVEDRVINSFEKGLIVNNDDW